MIVAISTDGFIAPEGGGSAWTSPEDKLHLRKILKKCNVQIMGAGTYTAEPLSAPKSGVKRIVLTHNTKSFNPAEHTTFISNSVEEILEKYKETDESVAILGGSSLFKEALLKGLADKVYLTVEPVQLKAGTRFPISQQDIPSHTIYKKISNIVLNKTGSQLFIYTK